MSKKRRRSGRFDTITSCISTTLVLLLLGGVVFLVSFAKNYSNQVRSEMPVAVLIQDNIPSDTLKLVQSKLQMLPYVKSVGYVSKEQGAKETYESMQMQPGEFIADNPILAEFELGLKGEFTNKDSIGKITPQLKSLPYVADVVYPIEEIDLLNRSISIIGSVLMSVALLLTFVSFALISNTIRMSIYARRLLIHTMKLVGAKWNFIRRPFMNQAFGIGFTSAVIADGLLLSGMIHLKQMDTYVSDLITTEVMLLTLGCVVVCGLVLTMLCAFMAVNKYLRMRGGDIYLK